MVSKQLEKLDTNFLEAMPLTELTCVEDKEEEFLQSKVDGDGKIKVERVIQKLHPFTDGNGRTHRFLIHDILARLRFVEPATLHFPVSATMIRNADYDEVLEELQASNSKLVVASTSSDSHNLYLCSIVSQRRLTECEQRERRHCGENLLSETGLSEESVAMEGMMSTNVFS